MGKMLAKTPLSPVSSRRSDVRSSCRNCWKEPRWISIRLGMAMISGNLAKLIRRSSSLVFPTATLPPAIRRLPPHSKTPTGLSSIEGARPGIALRRGIREPSLLDLNLGTRRLELGLDLLRLLFGDTFLDRLGCAVHQVLGLFQAQGGDGPDFFDHLNLLRTGLGEDDGELRLLLGWRGGTGGRHPGRHRHRGGDSGSRDAVLCLKGLDRLMQLPDCPRVDGFNKILNRHLPHRILLCSRCAGDPDPPVQPALPSFFCLT